MTTPYASLVSELAAYLQQSGLGTVGTDIFIGHMIPNPDNIIMLFPSGGTDQDLYLDTNYSAIDIWTRDRHSEVGYDKLFQVFEKLHRLSNIQLNRYYLYFLHASSHILDMDRDSQGRKLYKITFRAIYRDTMVVS